jgi:hypothetical protein
VYGETIPSSFTPTYEGLVNGDTQPATPATCTSDAHTGSGVGTYAITCSGAADPNYAITYAGAPVTVKPAPLTIQAPTGSATYGQGVTPTYSGLVNGDTGPATPPTCTPAKVGTSSTTCSGAADPNYVITYVGGTLTITPAPLTVQAPSATITYGAPIPTTLSPSYAGFVNGDNVASLSSQATCSTAATSSSPVGTYPITCSGAAAGNYAFTYFAGTLTITRASLTVQAPSVTVTYGAPVPASFTPSLSSFANGETLATSGVSGAAACGSTATTASPAGSYPITCTQGTLSAPNYSFGPFLPGTLTILKRGATLGYTGDLFFATGSSSATTASVSLQGLVTPAPGGTPDLTKSGVVFLLFNSTNLTMTAPDATCPATVTSTGVATCLTTLGLDNWTVIMSIPATNSYFTAPNSDPVVLTVYQPATDKFATAGGWITDPSYQNKPVAVSATNTKGNFGFTVRFKSGTTPAGQSVFVFRGADGNDYIFKTNSWQGGGLAFGTNTVSFSAKCNVTVINPTTGPVSGLGGGNFTCRVDAADNGASGDTYALSVYTSAGVLYHQAGTTSAQLVLGGGGPGGGNIVIHTR